LAIGRRGAPVIPAANTSEYSFWCHACFWVDAEPLAVKLRDDPRGLGMPAWRLRDFHDDDLDQATQVWDQSRQADGTLPVFPVSEVMASARAGQPAVVAVVADEVVGLAVAQVEGERAWVLLVALAARWRGRGIGSALLAELERRLRAHGVRRISALLPQDATGTVALHNSRYAAREGLTYFEKHEHLVAADASTLSELGGRVLPAGLWEAMAGMEREKQVIERRIVLPLANAEVAERFGVAQPKAVILFGPPGTGKTSFAKAVASRLGWPFVELFPSRLAASAAEGLAASLRHAFADLARAGVGRAVHRRGGGDRRSPVRVGRRPRPRRDQRAAQTDPDIPRSPRPAADLRHQFGALDAAFLRPGRFDYILPVGPSDSTARLAIWNRYLGPHAGMFPVDELVTASEMFTPADIEFAARKGAQAAFEREVFEQRGQPADLADYLATIADTRSTLSEQALAAFQEDTACYTRS